MKSFKERVVPMNQHPMVIFVLEQRFDQGIKVAEESCHVSSTLHIKEAGQSVAVAVNVAALVVQFFVPMGSVKAVLLVNDHSSAPADVIGLYDGSVAFD